LKKMKIYARKYVWYRDLIFQCQILFDSSIQHLMFDNKQKVIRYLLPAENKIKYVAIKEQDGKRTRIGIAQFTRDLKTNCWWIAGFIPTPMQNKGLGIYVGVASINEFFKRNPDCSVYSGSFSYNTRAVRTTNSLGFTIYVQDERHFEGALTKEQFNNEFVNYIKERCHIE